MKLPKIDQADAIKVFAVITAMPRWVGALLAAEGFALPIDWLVWWMPLSAVMSAGMAIVEGLAFSYVFTAWRNQKDKQGDNLLWFSLLSAILFVGVLAPYIAASVKHATLAVILADSWMLGAWSVAVGASTIAIVASVGYAQKQAVARKETQAQQSAIDEPKQETISNRERVLMLHNEQPGATHAQLAQIVGVSRQQVGKYLSMTRSNGKTH